MKTKKKSPKKAKATKTSKTSKKARSIELIKRTYSSKLKVESATGFLGKGYIGWTADATLQVTGTKDTMSKMDGDVLVSGQLDQLYDRNGKPANIPYQTSFSDRPATMANGEFNMTKETEYVDVVASVKSSSAGKTLTGELTTEVKGWWKYLANNILITGKGEQKGEDEIVEGELPDNPDQPDDPGVPPSEFLDPSKPFFGYGLVNNWSSQDPDKYLSLLTTHSIPCMAFEFFEWADPGKFAQVDTLIKKFKKFIDLSQSKKIALYVTIYNSNLGSGKYGDAKIHANKYDSQIKKVVNQFASWMKTYSNIYVTPVGEGGSQSVTKSYDQSIQNLCKATMPSNRLVNNWGSRPTSTDGMGFYCQHPASTSTNPPTNSWVMSDHSTIINQLNGGTGLYGKCNYDVTKAYGQKLWGRTVPFIYYHFDKNSSVDLVALKALKDATPAGAVTPPPSNPTTGTIAPSQVKWLSSRGPDYKNAATVMSLVSASMSGTHLNFKTDRSIPWPKRGSKNVNAIGILIRKIGSQYIGGKVEWCVGDRGWYDIKTNVVKEGYNGSTVPNVGEKCWAALGNPDNGSSISTIVPFTWV
ncbi:MAG: hypothetical protein M0R32_12050 [Candidatus Cloacimonetes bacterium]|jgi:hypothetical protein|nr:hypothetical protein [Candidatus Cloacimonadota bacterium]